MHPDAPVASPDSSTFKVHLCVWLAMEVSSSRHDFVAERSSEVDAEAAHGLLAA
jgi:hypothetical protein